MRRIDASLRKASALRLRFSQSLANRRQRLSQPMVRSTIHRFGSTTKPLCRSDRLTISVSRAGQDARQGAVKLWSFIGAVGEQYFQERKQAEQFREQRQAAIAILNIGGGDQAVQQQALGVDQNVALFALDQLARIEPVRIDAGPPFSALFTLWLSMMQAVGLASRSAFSRHLT